MKISQADKNLPKGWYFGPWNSSLGISIGYANVGVDESHYHNQVSEIYLVAHGSAELLVQERIVQINPGDAVLIEPGETHTFISSSADYFHFVLHWPGMKGDTAVQDKVLVFHELSSQKSERATPPHTPATDFTDSNGHAICQPEKN